MCLAKDAVEVPVVHPVVSQLILLLLYCKSRTYNLAKIRVLKFLLTFKLHPEVRVPWDLRYSQVNLRAPKRLQWLTSLVHILVKLTRT